MIVTFKYYCHDTCGMTIDIAEAVVNVHSQEVEDVERRAAALRQRPSHNW